MGVSALAGVFSLWSLWRQLFTAAALSAAAAVAAVVWGWGVAQFPYLLPQQLTISEGAASGATLTSVLIVFGVALVVVLPAIGFLYALMQRSMLEGEYERPESAAGT